MAFNPFHSFRKHRKVYFAILTIVCMFVFVLSSGIGGGGDVFDQVATWFGANRGRGKDVTKLYGDTVTEGELARLIDQRQLVTDFTLANIAEVQTDTNKDLGTTLEQLGKKQGSQEFKLLDAQIESELRFATLSRLIRQGRLQGVAGQYAAQSALNNSFADNKLAAEIQPLLQQNFQAQIALFRYSNERKPEEIYQDIFRNIDRLKSLRKTLAEQKRTNEAKLVDGMIAQLHLDAWLLNPDRPPSEFVLGGSPRTDDMLDFMVWKHQADKLGITITEADARKAFNELVGKEVLTGDSAKDREALRKVFKNRTVEPSDLYEYLADEFRVSLAQAIMLGKAPGLKGYRDSELNLQSAPVTPGDFYDYFRQQRTDLDLTMLPVPVSSVMGLVQANPSEEELKKVFDPEVAAAIRKYIERKPTEAELTQLFEAHKKREPEPWSERPGFKQPRKVSVEWVKLPEEPDQYRRDQARVELAGVWVGTDPWLALNRLMLVHRESRPAVETIRSLYPTPGLFHGDPGLAIINAGGDRHLDVATIVLQSAIPAGSLDPMAALGAVVKNQATLAARHGKTQARFIEAARRERAVSLAQFVVDGMAKTATGVPAFFANTSRVENGEPVWADPGSDGPEVAAEAVADKAIDWAIYRLARTAMLTDQRAFSEAVAKATEDTKNGDKIVKDALEKYHFKPYYNGPTRLLDQFSVKKEPSLKDLREEHQKALKGMEALGGSGEERFASRFFGAPSTYQPEPIGSSYLYWKKEDMPASEPKTMDEQTRKQVEEAWRQREARPIAKKIAESIQKKLTEKAKEAGLEAKIEETRKQVAEQTREDQKKLGAAQPGVIEAIAREKADAAARKVAREFYDKAFADLAKTYEAAKFPLGTPFTLDRVAHLRRTARGDVNNYDAWKAPEDTLPYPVAYLIDTALGMNPGQVTVLPDRPQENYYLTAQLIKRTPTVQEAFAEHETMSRLKSADPVWDNLTQSVRLLLLDAGTPPGDPIWRSYVEEREARTRKEVMDRLRREAGAVDGRGRFVVAEGTRREETPEGE